MLSGRKKRFTAGRLVSANLADKSCDGLCKKDQAGRKTPSGMATVSWLQVEWKHLGPCRLWRISFDVLETSLWCIPGWEVIREQAIRQLQNAQEGNAATRYVVLVRRVADFKFAEWGGVKRKPQCWSASRWQKLSQRSLKGLETTAMCLYAWGEAVCVLLRECMTWSWVAF